jgi:hypothetical protein
MCEIAHLDRVPCAAGGHETAVHTGCEPRALWHVIGFDGVAVSIICIDLKSAGSIQSRNGTAGAVNPRPSAALRRVRRGELRQQSGHLRADPGRGRTKTGRLWV